jgi:hypothetical protein
MSSRLVRIDYPRGGHGYALNGERIPGVTTVINQSSPAGGLIDWAAKEAAGWAATHVTELDTLGAAEWVAMAAGAANRLRDSRAERGRKVHDVADKLIEGNPVDVDDPEVMTRAEQVIDFLETWDADVLARECTVYHEIHKYAGTFDLVADLSDGSRWLLDYKTGSGVYSDVALQLAAYRYASHLVWGGNDVPMPDVDRCGVVWIREASWELIPVDASETVFATFLASMPVYRFHGTRIGKGTVGAPLPKPDRAAS